jgi:effector-binding domain-containing protein
MKYLPVKDMPVGMPSWEVYLNDPSTIAAEAEIVTDIYVTVAS